MALDNFDTPQDWQYFYVFGDKYATVVLRVEVTEPEDLLDMLDEQTTGCWLWRAVSLGALLTGNAQPVGEINRTILNTIIEGSKCEPSQN